MLDELAREFNKLSEDEQRGFLTRIIPAVRRPFINDPRRMIADMMSICRDMMSKPDCDMQGMMEEMCASIKRSLTLKWNKGIK